MWGILHQTWLYINGEGIPTPDGEFHPPPIPGGLEFDLPVLSWLMQPLLWRTVNLNCAGRQFDSIFPIAMCP